MSAEHRGRLAVELRRVSKVYGRGDRATLALDGVDLAVRQGEFVCLVGASGCGKSSLLHIIAGLEQPSSGAIVVQGGQAALMFQDAALFPWLSVEENVAFPLKMRGLDRKARAARAWELLEMVHLEGFARRQPHELSGGMRQRVALARALAQEAPVLLMDEPFAALDDMMRSRLHDELERVWAASGLTVIFVTHNVLEAVRLGDRVVLLSSRPGRVDSVFEVPLPRPRPRQVENPEIARIARTISARLRESLHVCAGSEDQVLEPTSDGAP